MSLGLRGNSGKEGATDADRKRTVDLGCSWSSTQDKMIVIERRQLDPSGGSGNGNNMKTWSTWPHGTWTFR